MSGFNVKQWCSNPSLLPIRLGAGPEQCLKHAGYGLVGGTKYTYIALWVGWWKPLYVGKPWFWVSSSFKLDLHEFRCTQPHHAWTMGRSGYQISFKNRCQTILTAALPLHVSWVTVSQKPIGKPTQSWLVRKKNCCSCLNLIETKY